MPKEQHFVAAHLSTELKERMRKARRKLEDDLETSISNSEFIRQAVERMCDAIIEPSK